MMQASQLSYQQADDRRQAEQIITRFHEDIQAVRTAIEPMKLLAERLGSLDKMVDGLVAMTKAAADQLDEFKKLVEIIERSLSPTDTAGYEEYAEDTVEGQERARRAEVRELRRRGVPEREAVARVRERDIYQDLARSRRQES